MKLAILYVVVVGAVLFWWLRSVKPKRRIRSRLFLRLQHPSKMG